MLAAYVLSGVSVFFFVLFFFNFEGGVPLSSVYLFIFSFFPLSG